MAPLFLRLRLSRGAVDGGVPVSLPEGCKSHKNPAVIARAIAARSTFSVAQALIDATRADATCSLSAFAPGRAREVHPLCDPRSVRIGPQGAASGDGPSHFRHCRILSCGEPAPDFGGANRPARTNFNDLVLAFAGTCDVSCAVGIPGPLRCAAQPGPSGRSLRYAILEDSFAMGIEEIEDQLP